MGIYRDLVLADLPAGGTFLEFNEASGTLVDSGGGGNNGTAAGAPTYGKPGPFTGAKALEFHKATDVDLVNIGNVFDFNGTQSFSVEFWEFIHTLAGINYQTCKLDTTNNDSGWRFMRDASNIWFRRTDAAGGAAQDQCVGTPKTDAWTHWCGTYDGANMNLYRDGPLHVGPVASTRALPVTTGGVVISSFHAAGGGSMDGLMTLFAYYPGVVLTPAQIEAHVEAALGCVAPQKGLFPHPPIGAPA